MQEHIRVVGGYDFEWFKDTKVHLSYFDGGKSHLSCKGPILGGLKKKIYNRIEEGMVGVV